MVILSGAFNSLLATYPTKYLGISIVECVISNTILFAKIDISSSIIWYFKEISGMLKCYKIIEIFLYEKIFHGIIIENEEYSITENANVVLTNENIKKMLKKISVK